MVENMTRQLTNDISFSTRRTESHCILGVRGDHRTWSVLTSVQPSQKRKTKQETTHPPITILHRTYLETHWSTFGMTGLVMATGREAYMCLVGGWYRQAVTSNEISSHSPHRSRVNDY
jgi:hypothetical protein